MASETVEILIEADDKASAKFEKVGQSAEKQVKAFKEVGAKAKASTELVGTLAGALGGTELGSFAGQLAQLTERVSAFSEVSKQGGAGALAFKAGLVGAAGVIGFQIGKALGDVIFQTEKWNRELEKSAEIAGKIGDRLMSTMERAFDSKIEGIELIQNPEEQKAALQALVEEIDKSIAGKNQLIKSLESEIASVDETWGGWFQRFSGNVRAINEANKEQVKEAERFKEALKDQAQELRERLAGERELLEARKQANIDAEKAAEDAARQAQKKREDAEKERIKALEKAEKDRLKAAEDAEKKRQKAIEDQINAQKRLAESRKSIVEQLKREAIALQFGEKAADAYSFKLQGFDDQTANALAAMKDRLRKAGEESKSSGPNTEAIGATQGRLLTRGSGNNQMLQASKDTAQATQQTLREINQVNRNLQRLIDKENITLGVASA